MNINSILSTFRMGSISTGYNATKLDFTSKKSANDLTGEDTFTSNKSRIMPRESYDYSSKAGTLSGIRREIETVEAQKAGAPEETDGIQYGDGSDDSEGKTETEVKVINDQAYMIITTTNEDGSTTIRKVKLGGKLAQGNDKLNSESSLADAVTM